MYFLMIGLGISKRKRKVKPVRKSVGVWYGGKGMRIAVVRHLYDINKQQLILLLIVI
jgi:hypothetical protein